MNVLLMISKYTQDLLIKDKMDIVIVLTLIRRNKSEL